MINQFCFKHDNLTAPDLTALVSMILEKEQYFIVDAPDSVLKDHIDRKYDVDLVCACKFPYFGIDDNGEFVCLEDPEEYGDNIDIIEEPTLEIITQHILEGSQ